MNKQELIKKGVRAKKLTGIDYFFVADIKEKFPDMKIETENIIYDSQENPIVESKYIKPLTDFDKTIKESLLFKPKNK